MGDGCTFPQCGTHEKTAVALAEIRVEVAGMRSVARWILGILTTLSVLIILAIFSAGGVVNQVEQNTKDIAYIKTAIENHTVNKGHN